MLLFSQKRVIILTWVQDKPLQLQLLKEACTYMNVKVTFLENKLYL